ncbi:hypothetical protein Val02_16660 [Virgisporangium aliadipatigenens]|uniref:histidine kinase n=1 Tax=Virgisporangium aliadipatigenens TaxID=741659 RepID=A0A8J3YIT3_9ACTN|nr:hypothetical protein Val02_16660 [Virgisporangium aliadipatigenens]
MFPGWNLIDHRPLDPVRTAVHVILTLVLGGALAWRLRAPFASYVVCIVGVTTAVYSLPDETIIPIIFADLIALYSVAARRPPRALLGATALGLTSQIIQLPAVPPAQRGMTFAMGLLIYVLTVGLGRARGRWRDGREEAARQLARAEEERRRAAVAERDRLARELHDVTAHHLTAILVHATAARRLTEKRPELAAEALEFARETGTRTLAALHRLVAVITPGAAPAEPLTERLDRLVDAAAQAGQVVRHTVGAGIDGCPPDVADAVHAVAREATTNAMRHAPGTEVTVTVSCDEEQVRVRVANAAPDAATSGSERLGSGRGLAGLEARVGELGGGFSAGPADGGWVVTVSLPLGAAAAVPTAAEEPRGVLARIADWWHNLDERLLDTAIVVATTGFPLVILYADPEAESDFQDLRRPSVLVLLSLLLILHGAPIWWRRRAPWRTLGAVAAGSVTYGVTVVSVGLPPDALWLLLLGLGTEMVAVHAVATYGRPAWASWAAVPVVSVTFGLLVTTAIVLADEIEESGRAYPAAVVTVCLVSMVPMAAMTGPIWLAGLLVRRRRDRTLADERAALARASARAVVVVDEQRARFASGLRASVLDPAERLIAAAAPPSSSPPADGPDPDGAARIDALDAVIAEARTGLAAMRELLGALHPEPAAGSAPPRGMADLDSLCAEHRSEGRDVQLSVGAVPGPLPVAVDLSGYRIVDTALDTDDTQPCAVRVTYEKEVLVVSVTGVPSAAGGVVAARIRARTGALGGVATFDPAGAVTCYLPASREPIGREGVRASSSA